MMDNTLSSSDKQNVGSKTNLPKKANIISLGNIYGGGDARKMLGTSRFSAMVYPSPSRNSELQIPADNNYQNDNDDVKFTPGGTEPLQHDIATTELWQDNEDFFDAEEEGIVPVSMPDLIVCSHTRYSRFRYSSEKVGGKGKRSADLEKDCLLVLKVQNYEGPVQVVAFCVDEQGNFHPYNLHGENCKTGVYMNHVYLRPNEVIRFDNVSITTPKTKEYDSNLKARQKYLEEVGCKFQEVKPCNDIDDKQVVYVMVKVILEDSSHNVLSKMTLPIHNKKHGKEFKISDVAPASAPANGHSSTNMQHNRVLIVVSEKTAFPKEVGVIIRDKDRSWVRKLTDKQIKVTKGAVVKFNPPPYKCPDIEDNVEVEICLYDRKTEVETEPVAFTYVATNNVYETKTLGNKRKLDENAHMDQLSVNLDNTTKESKKLMLAKRTKSSSSLKSVDAPSSSSMEDLQNNVVILVDKESRQQATFSGSQDRDVSGRQVQQDLLFNTCQLPFSSCTDATDTAIVTSAVDATSAQIQNYSVTSAEFEEGLFTPQQFVKEETNCCKPGQTSPAVMSSQNVFSSCVHDVYQNSFTSLMAGSQTSNVLSTSTQQQQDTQSQQGMNSFEIFRKYMSDLLLDPCHYLVIINGQCVIVYDDTLEMAPTAPDMQNSQQMLQNGQQTPQNGQQMQSYQGSVLQAVAAATNTQTSQPHLATLSAQPQMWFCPQTSASVARHQPASPMLSTNSAPIATQQHNVTINNIISSLQLSIAQQQQENHVQQTTLNQQQLVDVLQNQQLNCHQTACEAEAQGASIGSNLDDEDFEQILHSGDWSEFEMYRN